MNISMPEALSEQLAQQAAHDPLTALLLAQLTSSAEAEGPDGLDELEHRLEVVTRANRRLQEELRAANAMATHVARLLGACPACWGLDTFCRQCLGNGIPGSSEPDHASLVHWITPALDRAGLTISAQSAASQRLTREESR